MRLPSVALCGMFAGIAAAQSVSATPPPPRWSITVDASYSSGTLRGDMGADFLSSRWLSPLPDSVWYAGYYVAPSRQKHDGAKTAAVYTQPFFTFSSGSENCLGLHVGRSLNESWELRLGMEMMWGEFSASQTTGPYSFVDTSGITHTYSCDWNVQVNYIRTLLEPSVRLYVFSAPIFAEVGFPVSMVTESEGVGWQELNPYNYIFAYVGEPSTLYVRQPSTHLGTASLRLGVHLSIGGQVAIADFLSVEFSAGIRGPLINSGYFNEYTVRETFAWEQRLGLRFSL